MDEEYDVIVLGTGLKECILSGLLSVDGLKVLHMDRNDYYGGESTSLNLNQLWKRLRGDDKPPENLGASKEYNVDMIPKFMMANGTLVRVLIRTNVTKYLNFKAVDGSFVYNKGKIYKVPANDVEALKSTLMGLFEKRRARKFFIYVQDYEEDDPKSHEGLDLNKITARELISKYGLEDDTVDFLGHALALHRDDNYLDEPAMDTVKRMKLYAESLARFQGGSPYIYPLYGLGELPQGFARLSAVYGGTYMLNKPECKVEFDKDGKAYGVTSEGETAKCKKLVCDPSYLPDKVQKVGRVARAICIMSHPIPDTNDSHSVQIILPQKQLNRKSDMYLFCCSYSHNVAPKGKYIAFVCAEAETDNPETELKPGIDLLGPVDETFFDIYDRYEPINKPDEDNCFISTSYDSTTHFESTVEDVLAMYRKITGKVDDIQKQPPKNGYSDFNPIPCLFSNESFTLKLCYLLYWKKKTVNIEMERCHSHSNHENQISCHFLRRKPESLISSTTLNHQEMCIDSDGQEDSLEAELMRLHNLPGPPRLLFTIMEETKEDMESDDGKSKCGRRSRSDVLVPVETPVLTPLPSPPLFTPQRVFNPLFSSSPPPKFQFLRDAEEKLYRKTLMEEALKNQCTEGDEDGSFITVIIGQNREKTLQPLQHSSSSHGKLISFLSLKP
ncbi:hypothetical protein J5N97_006115 [Dioscorea zingiberensis]|uniref:Guanosine nucleotide diphosphate dissociation inhibitor n=1 Tax=Dioscorea zingiberensis TaxID=325984 RepID=A0A9D5DAY6_9LILI|nr:hypothetical protein J5N97_006115 [Dioscorea zingiberensis]